MRYEGNDTILSGFLADVRCELIDISNVRYIRQNSGSLEPICFGDYVVIDWKKSVYVFNKDVFDFFFRVTETDVKAPSNKKTVHYSNEEKLGNE